MDQGKEVSTRATCVRHDDSEDCIDRNRRIHGVPSFCENVNARLRSDVVGRHDNPG
jgi:hypothetical protein